VESEPFDIKKFLGGFLNPTTWSKSIIYFIMIGCILFILVMVKNTFFPNKTITNKPHTIIIGKAEKDSVNQSSTNTVVEKEKSFEVGAGIGVVRYDQKDGAIAGGWGKWRF
jgi:Na+(H+)/acetate symporter ActP